MCYTFYVLLSLSHHSIPCIDILLQALNFWFSNFVYQQISTKIFSLSHWVTVDQIFCDYVLRNCTINHVYHQTKASCIDGLPRSREVISGNTICGRAISGLLWSDDWKHIPQKNHCEAQWVWATASGHRWSGWVYHVPVRVLCWYAWICPCIFNWFIKVRKIDITFHGNLQF